ncbi:hypothetical protein Srubr_27050 [Streptomyces rubradiris]|uniref:Uncharacterized protein n=1 Tax=Streptomyces rubradiris TaxID=285531 RepID=A0ABQ3RAH8_STRRR|nr:hypothetical protein Srubr_26880 [Streptomyces rubradiris]GHI52852.1 hypothetical protein Srubr_26980 [Streptomyces rubradiris]GHI52854.1 hypothetical protein Srubr_27000 [Streptomyces rubradiris]GHI52857.1 hypothetical protein Srubr_27030 [Streptomyces rubradiris]GHI52859.1 hypothetical protein Srubr_27050 [Streptomyces rubradiris]
MVGGAGAGVVVGCRRGVAGVWVAGVEEGVLVVVGPGWGSGVGGRFTWRVVARLTVVSWC